MVILVVDVGGTTMVSEIHAFYGDQHVNHIIGTRNRQCSVSMVLGQVTFQRFAN